MPRATQSREAGIIHYFKTADLPIALVVMGLCKEALGERQARSAEARARVQRASPPVAPTTPPKPAPPVRDLAKAAVASHKKKGNAKGKAKSHKAKARPAPPVEESPAIYDEADLNG